MSLQEGPFVFRVNENGSGPDLLLQVCTERGWREYTESAPMKDGWNLWWKTSAFSVSQHRHLKAWQFTNHIPKGSSICRKDNLARNLKCMRKVYGGIYDISPHGYNLPLEYTKLVAEVSRRDDDNDESQKVWICKPVGQSQGRGIFLFKSLNDLCYDSNAVVQRYIKNPLLIGGYKFDLRLYVCVPSYHPLTIYLYKEGLVRFSTDKFSMSDLNNPFCHLTNSSLNKLGPGYSEQKDRVGAGCKWTLRQLRQYFQQTGIRDWLLWQKVSALVTLTVLSQSNSVPHTTNCFEFYGFDVLIDEKLKPWLLEVNLSPALGNDCDVDPIVKKPLLHDLFDLLGLPVCFTGLSLFRVFSPVSGKAHAYYSSNSESDGESRQTPGTCRQSAKAKSLVTGQTSRCASGVKSSASSAIMVATAASKWRRRRRSNYLFGPPLRQSIVCDKRKVSKEHLKSSPMLHTSINLISLDGKESKGEEKKTPEKGTEIQFREGDPARQEKRTLRTAKRSREKEKADSKIKPCTSSLDLSTGNNKPLVRTPCPENPKILMTKIENAMGDTKNKKKKKMDGLPDRRQTKAGTGPDPKGPSPYDRQKKVAVKGAHDHTVKKIVFPFDRNQAAAKGFKGRTKPVSPMLWGNGRDWRTPVEREGDWERIYPICNFASKYSPTFEEDCLGNKFSVGDKQIRLVVHHVTNFIKVSKQIYYKETTATEDELNARLINSLGMTGDVWLPSK